MLTLCPDFSVKNVIVWKQTVSKDWAFGLLYDSLVNGRVPFDAMQVWNDLTARVAQGVYMGNGLLLPHARVPGIQKPLVAFGVSAAGISGVEIGKNVVETNEIPHFVALVLSPENSPLAHTQVIGKIARFIFEEKISNQLLVADTAETVFKILTENFKESD